MSWNFLIYGVINTLFVVAVSPLFMNLIKKVKAAMQGRRGPPLLQGYYQLLKLLKKENLYAYNSSVISRLSPYLNIVFLLASSLFIPVTFLPQTALGIGNVILFLYLLVMAKFFMALGGLDSGSSFGGMGSSREMTISAIFEPVVVIVVAALAFTMKTVEIPRMFAQAMAVPVTSNAVLILICAALFVVLIIETSRIPVDNPETHLELTMVHEAMILEASGPNLALLELSHAIKNTLLMGLLINILAPWGLSQNLNPIGLLVSLAAFLGKGCLLALVVGFFESIMAKSRLFNIRVIFIVAFSLAFLTIALELLI